MEKQSYTDQWPHYGYHRCEGSTKGEQDVVYASPDNGDEACWNLYLCHRATKEDLDNFAADIEGEVLNGRQVAIAFCPFCGKNLEKDLPEDMKEAAHKSSKTGVERL